MQGFWARWLRLIAVQRAETPAGECGGGARARARAKQAFICIVLCIMLGTKCARVVSSKLATINAGGEEK